MDRGRYNISLRYLGTTDAKYGAVFDVAAARWERIIIADEPSVTGTLPTQLCGAGAPPFTGTVDDILIDVILTPTDGPGRVLGSAGTRNAHWREATFFNELMTGFLNASAENLLSRVTAGPVRDLGYGTAITAEPYRLPEPADGTAGAGASGGAGITEDGVDIAAAEELLELQAIVAPTDPRQATTRPRRR